MRGEGGGRPGRRPEGACAARRQIDGKKYDATFRAEGIADVVKIGLAYCKDKVELSEGE